MKIWLRQGTWKFDTINVSMLYANNSHVINETVINLNTTGNLTVNGDALVKGRLDVNGDVNVTGTSNLRTFNLVARNYMVAPSANFDIFGSYLLPGTTIFTQNPVSIRADNTKLYFGMADDSSIYYNGTDMVVNPQEVGAGSVSMNGDLSLGLHEVSADVLNGRVTRGDYFTSSLATGFQAMFTYDAFMGTIKAGKSIVPDAPLTLGGVASPWTTIYGSTLKLNYDNGKAYFGAADDASIYYDGNNMVINPAEVGAGAVLIGSSGSGTLSAYKGYFTYLNSAIPMISVQTNLNMTDHNITNVTKLGVNNITGKKNDIGINRNINMMNRNISMGTGYVLASNITGTNSINTLGIRSNVQMMNKNITMGTGYVRSPNITSTNAINTVGLRSNLHLMGKNISQSSFVFANNLSSTATLLGVNKNLAMKSYNITNAKFVFASNLSNSLSLPIGVHATLDMKSNKVTRAHTVNATYVNASKLFLGSVIGRDQNKAIGINASGGAITFYGMNRSFNNWMKINLSNQWYQAVFSSGYNGPAVGNAILWETGLLMNDDTSFSFGGSTDMRMSWSTTGVDGVRFATYQGSAAQSGNFMFNSYNNLSGTYMGGQDYGVPFHTSPTIYLTSSYSGAHWNTAQRYLMLRYNNTDALISMGTNGSMIINSTKSIRLKGKVVLNNNFTLPAAGGALWCCGTPLGGGPLLCAKSGACA